MFGETHSRVIHDEQESQPLSPRPVQILPFVGPADGGKNLKTSDLVFLRQMKVCRFFGFVLRKLSTWLSLRLMRSCLLDCSSNHPYDFCDFTGQDRSSC